MHLDKVKYAKIFAAIGFAYLVSALLINSIFLNPLHPFINVQEINNNSKNYVSMILEKMTTRPKYTLTPGLGGSTGFSNQFNFPTATNIPTPIPSDTPAPTVKQNSATLPTATPRPSATPTQKIIPPTAKPTLKPTAKPQPTNTSVPTQVASYTCPTTSNESYSGISVNSSPSSNAQAHPDINIHIRGYSPTSEKKELVDYPGDTDFSAPQLTGLISGTNFPKITGTYKVYDWNWSNNTKGGPISDWPVTLIGLEARSGQQIKLPSSGYDIGGAQAMVLYAEKNTVTLKYTREDNVVTGYTIHLDDICVDPNLLSKYQQLNSQGRGSLPALSGGKVIGTAKGEVKVVIRDTGQFMDPRSKKDWWAK